MTIPGSEYLISIFHALSQSLLLPNILALLLLFLFAFMEMGSFVSEKNKRKGTKSKNLVEVFHDVEEIVPWQQCNLQQTIENSSFNTRQKNIFNKFISKKGLSLETRRLIAQDILDKEEFSYQKVLEKTDLLAKLGPVLGLMGTLIPLGPGLAGMGQGDVKALADSMVIAFDTTVAGVAIGGIGALISKVRRRWYQQDLNNMEVILELTIGGETDASQEKETGALVGGRG